MVPEDGHAPTLARVAESAGVSVATVSKVLNGRSDVGAETRARVERLLVAHDYVARRGDAGERGDEHTVELVFHGPLGAYTSEVLRGVLEAGVEAGVAVVVSVRPRSQPSPGGPRPAAWARRLVDRGRRAVIDVVDDAQHGDLAALLRAGLPLVVIDPLSPPRKEVASVGTTNFSGGLAATSHLIALGHRRIAYLGADATATWNQARVHGYRAALEAAGLEATAGYVRIGSFDYDAGVEGGGALLDLDEPPTAVFAGTDELAAGVIEAARRRGVRVPEGLSVVGFDDTSLARTLSPPLTTVRQPLREMGRLALQTALRLASREPLDSHHVELATELVVRSSTAAPAS